MPFTVSCSYWTDEDDIKDYSLLTWAEDPAERTLIAFSSISTFKVYLPTTIDPIPLMISIRDRRNCAAEWTNLSSIFVQSDFNLSASLDEPTTNPLVQLLSSANPNVVGQVIGSLSEDLYQLNNENLQETIQSRSFILSTRLISVHSRSSRRCSCSDDFCFAVGSGSIIRRGLFDRLPV